MADFTPKDQFQQFVVDRLESHTEKIDRVQEEVGELRASCPVWEVETRVTELEMNQKWYKKIYVVVTGAIVATLAITFEWLLHRSK
jgi:hypothetical protein